MKYYECPVSQTLGFKAYSQSCGLPVTCKSAASLKPVRSVHFPNDIVFQDYVRHGELERIGRFIRASRVKLDTIYHSGMAAIHEAVLTGNLECVKLLVHYGADIHQRDEEGWTPLHMACSDGFPHIARQLTLPSLSWTMSRFPSATSCRWVPTPSWRTTAARGRLT
ncbi:protein phosphatase 1 regulatory subunit 27b isoform 2-T2 [Anableps anableps]